MEADGRKSIRVQQQLKLYVEGLEEELQKLEYQYEVLEFELFKARENYKHRLEDFEKQK